MCRVLAYLGKPVLVDDLLYKPDSSLIRQGYAPQMLQMLSLAGFGMAAWAPESHDPERPFVYRSTALPVFDRNLSQLAQKLMASSLIAHVRGVAYSPRVTVGEQNLHPFQFAGAKLAMAHNGDLYQFDRMKLALLEHVKPELAVQVRGNTDSEWIYALLLSQLDDPAGRPTAREILRAAERSLRIVRRVREAHGIATSSSVNLFIGDGETIVAVRFTFDFGCYPLEDASRVHEANLSFLSLWYTLGTQYGCYGGEWKMSGDSGSADSVLISSEPLTRDVSTWLEVPEYNALYTTRDGGKLKIGRVELDV